MNRNLKSTEKSSEKAFLVELEECEKLYFKPQRNRFISNKKGLKKKIPPKNLKLAQIEIVSV